MSHSNVLWIDTCVKEYQIFVESVNSNTQASVYSSSTTQTDILNSLSLNVDRIGIVFSDTNLFLGEPFYSESNTSFFIDTIRIYHIKNIDFLACDTLRDPLFRDFYSKLHTETGVIVGASDNKTGNIKYGGDWILESTSEDIEHVYFTNTIEYYTYVLGLGNFTMVLKSDGTIWGTGSNFYGGLGNGTSTNRSSFQNITTLQSTDFKSKTVKSILTGRFSTVVLMTDGTLWGAGYEKAIGVTPIENLFTLIPISGTITQISCGGYHTVILKNDNTLWGTGDSNKGQIGTTNANGYITVFTQIPGITGTIKMFACGFAHTVVLTTDNILWVSGLNSDGQLGKGDKINRLTFTPVNIGTQTGRIPKLISCGETTTFILMTDGTLWGAGHASYSGTNNTATASTFVQVSNSQNYKNGTREVNQLVCGYRHTIMLMTDNTLWGVGGGSYGEFGITSVNYRVFTQLTTPTTISSIWAGGNITVLLGSNNTLYLTGDNRAGALGFASLVNYTSFTSSLTDVLALPEMIVEYTPAPSYISSICFPSGTLIKSDQGHIPIQKLIKGYHTLHGEEIIAVTETYSMDKVLVCVEKDALRKNCPDAQTFMSPRHKIYYKGKLKAAHRFVKHHKGFTYVHYKGEKLYNVLLNEYGTMNVQGMICETLDPSNPMAKHYRGMEKDILSQ